MLEEAEDKAARAAVEGRHLRTGVIRCLPKPYNRQPLSIIETPYSGDVEGNIAYARATACGEARHRLLAICYTHKCWTISSPMNGPWG